MSKFAVQFFEIRSASGAYWQKKLSVAAKTTTDLVMAILKKQKQRSFLRIDSTTDDSKQLDKDGLLIMIGISDGSSQTFEDPQVFEELFDSEIRTVTQSLTHVYDSHQAPRPLLLIGPEDIMDPQASIHRRKDLELDHRYKFWDSSIWHRYVSMDPVSSFKGRLLEIIDDMVRYHQLGLYYAFAAQEALEYQCRLVKNDYILNIGSGHKHISPFIFYSESRFRKRAEKKKSILKGLQWGAHVIDDHFDESLAVPEEIKAFSADEANKSLVTITNKRNLLDRLLNDKDATHPYQKDRIVFIPPVDEQKPGSKGQNILSEAAENLCDNPNIDLIFIDYYLGKDEQNQVIEGISFVKRLLKESPLRHTKPFDKHWLFPMSVFSSVLKNRLLGLTIEDHGDEAGISLAAINEKLYISNGADPINTPEFFRYSVFSMLEEQKQMLEFQVREILDMIGLGEGVKQKELPQVLRKQFPQMARKIVNYYLHREVLAFDSKKKENGPSASYFAKSFQQQSVVRKLVAAFCLHVQHLIYLLAFDDDTEWPRMWQELQVIRNLIYRLKEEDAGSFSEAIETYMQPFDAIKEHIKGLRKSRI